MMSARAHALGQSAGFCLLFVSLIFLQVSLPWCQSITSMLHVLLLL